MGKLARVIAVVLAGITAVVATVTQADVAGADPAGDEAAIVAKINEFRMGRGLRPLSVRGELANVARGWSLQMQRRNGLAHNPNLATQAPPDWERLGENVAMGRTVQEIHDGWAASSGHVAQMAHERFDAVGVGVVPGGGGNMFVTVDFMTSQAAAPPPSQPAATPPPPAQPPAPAAQAPPPSAQAAAPAPAGPARPAARRVCRRTRRGRVCSTRRLARRAAPRRARAGRRVAVRRR